MLILAVPKSPYSDVDRISAKDNFGIIPETPQFFIQANLYLQ